MVVAPGRRASSSAGVGGSSATTSDEEGMGMGGGLGRAGTLSTSERKAVYGAVPDGEAATDVAGPSWKATCERMSELAEDLETLVIQGLGEWVGDLLGREERKGHALLGALRALHSWKYRDSEAMEAAVAAEGQRRRGGGASERASERAVRDAVVGLTRDLGALLVGCMRSDTFLKENDVVAELWGYCADVLTDHLGHVDARDPIMPRKWWSVNSHGNDPVRHCLRSLRLASARFDKLGGPFEKTAMDSIFELQLLPLCVKVLEKLGTEDAGTDFIDREGCKDTVKFLSNCCDSETFRQASALPEDLLLTLDAWIEANKDSGHLGEVNSSASRRMLRPVLSFVMREKLRTGLSKPPDLPVSP